MTVNHYVDPVLISAMGYLKHITIYEDEPVRLGKAPRCVEHHFARHLRGCKMPGITQINLRISNSKPVGSTERFGSILDYYGQIEIEHFSPQMSDPDKKRLILDAILCNMKALFSSAGWDITRVIQAYDKCVEESLENEWFFKRKLFRSPDGMYHFGLLNRFGLERFEILEVLHDANKIELARRPVFIDRVDSFHIDWASWEGSNEEFCYRFDGPKKIFTCSVQELLDGEKRTVPDKVSDYFK